MVPATAPQVLASCCGPFATTLPESPFGPALAIRLTADPAAREQQLAAQVPLGRLGQPEEIAAANLLASGQSSFITGSSRHVDGDPNRI